MQDGLHDTENPIIIRQLKSSSNLKINVLLHGKEVDAILDTASQVTIISDEFYNTLSDKPEKVRAFTLCTAGRNMAMKGYLLEPVQLEINGNVYKESIYVAPLEDAMLIGLDFMSKHQTTLDIKQGHIRIQDQNIPFIKGSNSVPAVSKTQIRITKKTHIPPRSVIRISCVADSPLLPGLYIIEPDINTVLAPRVCFEGAGNPIMSFVNNSDSRVTLFKSQRVGFAYEVDEISQVSELTGKLGVSQVSQLQGEQ